ncbi:MULTISPECIES: PRC-barrel domain-containing protein [unclassified Curtobacterium]|uniref:PRC-barrel domain-containing protein n=1 Tax=unclassified Curtobacterium TaxID=257496 RepID=UPI000D85BA9C|nr:MULTISPECIES: PRC-barrel domain-containing protein [unclassified Curtobacterium]PYY55900.1 PRC-barrel domain containing protein [Curtobacterium sp. MCSS17_011]WIE79235.1 PRC-barrel domain-containing protein [Curtobacterium sp. MCSS17_016]
MLLSDLLNRTVTDADGARLGRVLDVRFVLDGPVDGQLAAPQFHGILVSPRRASAFLGYERSDMRAPWLVAHYLHWRNRDTFLVLRNDIARVNTDGVTLQPNAQHWSPQLTT